MDPRNDDVTHVIRIAKVHPHVAISALQQHGNDAVEAIMFLAKQTAASNSADASRGSKTMRSLPTVASIETPSLPSGSQSHRQLKWDSTDIDTWIQTAAGRSTKLVSTPEEKQTPKLQTVVVPASPEVGKLHRQIVDNATEIQQLVTRNKEMEDLLRRSAETGHILMQENEKLKNEAEEQKNVANEWIVKCKEAEDRIHQLNRDKSEMLGQSREQIKDIEDKFEKTSVQFNQILDRCARAEEENGTLRMIIDRLKMELDDKETSLTQVKAIQQQEELEIANLQDKINEFSSLNAASLQLVEQLTSEKQNLEQCLDEHQKIQVFLKGELESKLKEQNRANESNAVMEDLRKQVAQQEQKQQSLIEQKLNIEKSHLTLEQQFKEKSAQLGHTMTRIGELERALEEWGVKYNNLKLQHDGAKSDFFAALERQIEESDGQLMLLQNQLKDEQKQRERDSDMLRERMEGALIQCQVMSSEMDELRIKTRQSNQELQNQLEASLQKREEQETIMSQLQLENDELKSQLHLTEKFREELWELQQYRLNKLENSHSLEDQLASYRNENDRLRQRVNAALKEAELSHQLCREKEQEVARLRAEVERLRPLRQQQPQQSSLSDSSSSVRSVDESQMNALKEQIQTLQSELSRTKSLCDQVEAAKVKAVEEKNQAIHILQQIESMPLTCGVGLEIEMDDKQNQCRVKSLLAGYSAVKSGALQVGDIIEKIDNTPITGFSTSDVRGMIIGPRATSVVLDIRRNSEIFQVTLKRGHFGKEHAVVTPISPVPTFLQTAANTSSPTASSISTLSMSTSPSFLTSQIME